MELKVNNIIQEVLSLDNDIISHLGFEQKLSDFGLDSIKAIEMIVLIEDTFNITVDDEDLLLDNLNSVKLICDLIKKYCLDAT